MAKQQEAKLTKKKLIADAIAACADREGRIRPSAVVKAARPLTSILHDQFEWDDQIAAEQQRLGRAKQLIKEVRYEFVHEDVVLASPYYIQDITDEKSSYVPTIRVAKNKAVKRRSLEVELERIKSAILRARNLSILFGLESQFEDMLALAVEVEGSLHGSMEPAE